MHGLCAKQDHCPVFTLHLVWPHCTRRQLCIYVDAHSVYCTMAEILDTGEDLLFVSLMVQVLNLILFTATELYHLRMQLTELSTPVSELHAAAPSGHYS